MDATKPELIESFRQSLSASGKADSTISFYLMKTRDYLRCVGDGDPFRRDSVERYLSLLREKGDGSATLRNRFFILKTLFRTMGYASSWTFDKRDAPRLPAVRNKPVFSADNMAGLEEAAKRSGSLRDYAIVRLADATGIRRVELRSLNLHDAHLAPADEYDHDALARLTPHQITVLQSIYVPHIHVETYKGGFKVQRDIDPETTRALAAYIQSRMRKRRVGGNLIRGDPDAVFIAGVNGGRISLGTLSRIMRRLRVEAGIQKPKAGYHASRRGRITALYEAGVGRSELIAEMGWRSPSSIDSYIVIDLDKSKKRIRELHPYFKDNKH